MADVVQLRLERMAEELEDLERRGLFSRAELDSVVRRRREFEFRLKRPSPLKSDILAYIDYERKLDALREMRRRKVLGQMKRKNKNRGKKWKKSISDWAGVKRILGVYRMATMRFKGDLGLWFKYLEFCREKKHGRMKEALAQAIRYNPKVPGLWIYAAAWEFDHNLNVEAARSLMQSGLRSCPKSEDLWVEYLRMELTYLNKLRVRKQTLGENINTGNNNDEWKEENKDAFMALNEEKGESLNNDIFWKKGMLMLSVIYRGAIEAVPESFELRKKFLEILSAAKLGDTNQLKEEVMSDLRRDFSRDDNFWDWFARVQIGDGKGLEGLSREEAVCKINKAVEVYEEAIKTLSTERMFSLYAKFWSDMLHESKLEEINSSSSLLKVYQQAYSSDCLSKHMACNYVKYYVETGKLDDAKELIERLCKDSRFLKSGELWNLRVSLEVKLATCESNIIGKEKFEYILGLVKLASDKVLLSEAEDMWLLVFKIFSNNKRYFDKLVKSAIFAIAKSSGGGANISRAIISSVLQKDGIIRARDMYKQFISLPRPSLDLFKFCIELESNLASFGNDKNALGNVRKLYESALGFYSHDKELWRDYYMMEMKVGTSETASAVYWRARKTLKSDPTLT